MSQKAEVTRTGAIRLGSHVACDAYDKDRPLRTVTHAHADHTIGLRQSLRKCETVLMTPATRDLLNVMTSPLFLMQGNVKTIEYGKPLFYNNMKLTLHPADHILGAAQVLVEEDDTRMLYTGDFRLDETPVIEADILVTEATYGSPMRVRNFKQEVKQMLIELTEKGLSQGPVYVFGYHGKLQEVMHTLRDAGIKAPFIMSEKVFHVSKIYEQHGVRIGACTLATDEAAKNMVEKKDACILFCHMATRNNQPKDAFRIRVSGWEFHVPCRQTGENEYVVALSDHSDFNGLLQYIKVCKPKLVITDNYRVGHAEEFAREIEKRLQIKAKPLPS